jgi:signal transduction histidine kinase
MDEARRLKDFAEAAADWFWETDAGLAFSHMTAASSLPDGAWSLKFVGRRIDAVEGIDAGAGGGRSILCMMQARLPFRDQRLVCRDGGAALYLLLSGVPIFADGGFIGYRGIARDFTLLKRAEDERARAEQELAETSELLRATLDNMDQGILALDAELRIRLWNDRMQKHFRHGPGELRVERPVESLIRDHGADDPQRAAAEIAFLERCHTLRRSGVREFMLPDGKVIEMRAMPMPGGGLVVSYADVTERYNAEQELRRAKEEAELASRSKGEFLANVTHELRTPLNAIIGFADILKGEVYGPLGDRRYLDYAADIRDSGLHLMKLINDVLDVSKIEFGKIALNEEPVEIAGTVQACARLMRDRVEAGGLELRQALPAGLPLVHCDELRLKQILLNLLSNAVKFTPPGGRVDIRAALEDGGLGIVVQDTGIGIAAADLEKAMRPFGQIDSRLSRKYQGTGLGLPLAKSMIELHGGRLEIESTPGVGTKVTVWFPAERILFPAEHAEARAG